MEGFLTNVTMPVATLVFCLVLPQSLLAPIFIALYSFYTGYLIIRRGRHISNADSLRNLQGCSDEETTQAIQNLFKRDSTTESMQFICKAASWCVLILGIVLCFL